MDSAHLTQLPVELHEPIVRNSSPRELVQLALSSRALNRLARRSLYSSIEQLDYDQTCLFFLTISFSNSNLGGLVRRLELNFQSFTLLNSFGSNKILQFVQRVTKLSSRDASAHDILVFRSPLDLIVNGLRKMVNLAWLEISTHRYDSTGVAIVTKLAQECTFLLRTFRTNIATSGLYDFLQSQPSISELLFHHSQSDSSASVKKPPTFIPNLTRLGWSQCTDQEYVKSLMEPFGPQNEENQRRPISHVVGNLGGISNMHPFSFSTHLSTFDTINQQITSARFIFKRFPTTIHLLEFTSALPALVSIKIEVDYLWPQFFHRGLLEPLLQSNGLEHVVVTGLCTPQYYPFQTWKEESINIKKLIDRAFGYVHLLIIRVKDQESGVSDYCQVSKTDPHCVTCARLSDVCISINELVDNF